MISYGDHRVRVIIDPIDGSLNAKRGIPSYALSIAVADGETMADVAFGFVHDFGPGEQWWAWRGEGAWLDGERLDPDPGRAPRARRTARGARHRVRRPPLDRSLDRGARRTAPTACALLARSPPRCARWRPPASTAWSPCGARAGSTPPPGSSSFARQAATSASRGAITRWAHRSPPIRPPRSSPPARQTRWPCSRGSRRDRLGHRQADRHVRGRDRRGRAPDRRPGCAGCRGRDPRGRVHGPHARPAAPTARGHQPARNGWPTNLDSMRLLLDPVLKRAGDNLGPLKPVMEIGMGIILSTEVGVVVGYLGQRVLGQYELVLLDEAVEDRPAAPALRTPQPRAGGAGVRGRGGGVHDLGDAARGHPRGPVRRRAVAPPPRGRPRARAAQERRGAPGRTAQAAHPQHRRGQAGARRTCATET